MGLWEFDFFNKCFIISFSQWNLKLHFYWIFLNKILSDMGINFKKKFKIKYFLQLVIAFMQCYSWDKKTCFNRTNSINNSVSWQTHLWNLLKHIKNINTMQIALALCYAFPKFSFPQNHGHLMQILIDLLNSFDRLFGEQHK